MQLSRLVAKLRSCPVAATGIVRAGFIFTIPDAEEIAAGVIVENKVGLASLLLLIVDIGTIAWLFIWEKKIEFNKLADENIKLY